MNEHDDAKIRKLLKASPKLTPPESFYREVLQKVEQKSGRAEGKTPWYWRIPAKTLATACVLMIVVLATRGKKKSELNLLQSKIETAKGGAIQNESRPAPQPKSVVIKAKEIPEGKTVPSSQPFLDASVGRRGIVMQARDAGSGATSPGSFWEEQQLKKSHQTLATEPVQTDQARAESHEEQKQTIVKDSLKKTLAVAGLVSRKIFPAKITAQSTPMSAGAASSQEFDEWRGTTSGIDHFREVVVRNQKEWATLWNEHAKITVPPSPVPIVDFDHDMVVGIFIGSKPSGGYSVGIATIRLEPDRMTVIYYEMEPEAGRAYASGITQPHVMRIIPKTELPVVFLKAQ